VQIDEKNLAWISMLRNSPNREGELGIGYALMRRV